ncbi:MAG: ABC transporter permease [Acidobacteriota bacterium]
MRGLIALGRRFPEIPVLCALCGACLLAPLFTGAHLPLPPPTELHLDSVLQPPSRAHWLGTDMLGRDLLSRLLHGGRTSLAIAAAAALLAMGIGSILGLWAGHAGGWVDLWVGRLMETTDCLPTLVVALAGAASGYGRGLLPIILIVAVTCWTDIARLARSEALHWRSTLQEQGARAAGAGPARLLLRHLLPSALPLLATACAITAAEALVVEAGLGLLGFGVEPPQPTWGNLLLEARRMLDEAWWQALFPGVALFLSVAGFVGLAERAGLRPGQISAAGAR